MYIDTKIKLFIYFYWQVINLSLTEEEMLNVLLSIKFPVIITNFVLCLFYFLIIRGCSGCAETEQKRAKETQEKGNLMVESML